MLLMRRGLGFVLVVGMLACLLAACADREVKIAYDTAVVSRSAYDVALSSMGDLYRAGLISEAQKESAIGLGRVYKQAHNDMVEALAAYQEDGESLDKKQAYLNAAARTSKALADLLDYVKPYTASKEGRWMK